MVSFFFHRVQIKSLQNAKSEYKLKSVLNTEDTDHLFYIKDRKVQKHNQHITLYILNDVSRCCVCVCVFMSAAEQK